MRIDRIELYHVAMPLLEPWRTAYGEDAAVEGLLCRLGSGSLDAWGESVPFAAPCYSPEWAGGAFHVASQWFAPALLHQTIAGPQDWTRLDAYKGNRFAKAALETAWWNLYSQSLGQPLHTTLGATRDWVPVGADFGVEDKIDQLLEKMQPAIEQGFPRIKLKFRPGWDIPMLQAVRGAFPKQTMHIDCNSGYTLDDLDLFRQLDPFELAMIEQPLSHDDLLDHAQLQAAVKTPLCLDESMVHASTARQAVALGSCRYVNVKPGRVGGLRTAMQIHDVCREAGIPCWVGGMLESAIGSHTCVALAMLDNFLYPADIFPSRRFYREDLADPPLELEWVDGQPGVRARDAFPSPVPERLRQWQIQQAVFK